MSPVHPENGSFRKVFSPVIGYSGDYDLLHFVYDLAMWSSLGACKNMTQGKVPLRLALKNASFSPAYWRVRHLVLIDMQRQCGTATLFRTRAPYERTFPYHQWILDEMNKTGRARQHLAGPETLHMAHVLRELDRGYFLGMNTRKTTRPDRQWTQHLYSCQHPHELRTVKNGCSRLEFQDGKRKRTTQRYHGRGTVHSHSLDYLENLHAIGLEQKFSAHLPPEEEPLLRGLVLDGQRDYKKSGWPVREEPSVVDADTQQLQLQHTREDHDLNLRAYVPETMEITKCHEDVTHGHRGVMKYVASYAPKFSDSFAKDWLNDDASDYSVARRILFDYHPLEPEMWLTLAGNVVQQCWFGGTFRSLVAPWPGMDNKPTFVQQYEDSRWRGETMTLLEFLRKTNDDGDIIQWLRKKHTHHVVTVAYSAYLACPGRRQTLRNFRADLIRAHKRSNKEYGAAALSVNDFAKQYMGQALPVDSLETFANQYKTQGEKLIAADTLSRFNDRYYGQWLALNVPYRRLEDLLVEEVTDKVNDRYKLFACALHHAPDYWDDNDALRRDMQLEAFNESRIETILSKVKAQKHVVHRYLTGEIDKGEEVHSEDEDSEPCSRTGAATQQPKLKYHQAQKAFGREIDMRVQEAMKAHNARDDAEREDVEERAREEGSILAGMGPPGTGKTLVINDKIKKWKKRGARILFALPTGQLAARMRQVHPDIDVDTCHGAFLLHCEKNESLPILTQYDLVVIDEISMLSKESFDRITEMWLAAGKLCCLVVLGDFWQLPGPHKPPSRASDSFGWRFVKTISFVKVFRCTDERLGHKVRALRTAVPSMKLLRKIADRRHRAWTNAVPTAYDVLQVLRRTNEKTIVVTCTRKGAATINALALQVLFTDRHKQKIGDIPFDYEANLENYDARGQIKEGQPPTGAWTPLYEGMRVFLTKNLNKEDDFVNGMSAVVLAYDRRSRALEVRTETGKRLAVYPHTDNIEKCGRVTCYPVRLGYASTVQKIQGATLDHVTIYLDRAGCKAAAYVALSRVKTDADYLIAGRVTPKHFVPAM